jgi:YtfJ family uncharacterized protein
MNFRVSALTKISCLSLGLLCTTSMSAALTVGSIAPQISLDGKEGGKVKGGAWSSDELKGKVHVLFYVAPAEKDLNKPTTDAIKKEEFSREAFASVAIVNMAASSWPDFVIARKLEDSQKEFPNTLYIKDVKKKLVKEWGLKDDSSHVVAFDKDGKVFYSVGGKLTAEQTTELVGLIRKNVQSPAAPAAK